MIPYASAAFSGKGNAGSADELLYRCQRTGTLPALLGSVEQFSIGNDRMTTSPDAALWKRCDTRSGLFLRM